MFSVTIFISIQIHYVNKWTFWSFWKKDNVSGYWHGIEKVMIKALAEVYAVVIGIWFNIYAKSKKEVVV